MVNKELRAYIAECYPDVIILDNEAYDDSIIGVDQTGCHLIYSESKMIEEYMKDNNCSYTEAIE